MTPTALTPQKEQHTLKTFFPILGWLPAYQRSWLRPDLIAALTVWTLVVPEAMAYTSFDQFIHNL
jgi:MFS superfamily sulfate permease-like transporter